MKPIAFHFFNLITAAMLLIMRVAALHAEERDSVMREISCQNGAVWVEDKLSLRAHLALRDGVVDAVFNAVRQDKTNLLEQVRTLMAGENLEVQRYDAKVRGEFVDIHVVSKVAFKPTPLPSKLHWVCFLGGTKIKFPKGSIGPRGGSGLEMLIFDNNGRPVLWFPDLGTTDHFLDVLDEHRESTEWAFEGANVEYRCVLNMGKETTTLFAWSPGTKATGRPDSSSIKKMDLAKKMVLNDVYTLFTNLKIAKPGYYAMRAGDDPAAP